MEDFDKNGLVIEKDRVLTYSKLVCPLECKYCFVEALNNNQTKKVAYLTPIQLELLSTLPEEIKTIMLGCDTEFLQNQEEALDILNKISDYKKNISIITKLTPSENFLLNLKAIQDKLSSTQNVMTFSISLPCLESGDFWEPRVPSPEKRIETLKTAHRIGLNCMLAIRPLIPNIKREEILKIIDATKDFVFGYYSGPIYLKEDSPLLSEIDLSTPNVSIEKTEPNWMPQGNTFLKIENIETAKFLSETIKLNGGRMFEGAADGIDFLLKTNKNA